MTESKTTKREETLDQLTAETERLGLYDAPQTTKEAEFDVLAAACAWYGADIYVHPYLDRADAIHEAEERLIKSVQKYLSLQQPVEAKAP